jgi:hypothetical protein
MARKSPFTTNDRPVVLVGSQKAKMQKAGDWWFAHSHYVWIFFGAIWIGLTCRVAIGHSPKLAWVCGMVAFLQMFRGWEVYKHQKAIEKLTSQYKSNNRRI